MRTYLRVLWFQLRTSTSLALQYRLDFVSDGLVEVLWTVSAMVPLFVAFGVRSEIAGWSFGEALMVTGFFTLLQGVLEGTINPSVALVVDQIRKGTFDFVLLKPVDAQFLASTASFLPWRAVNVLVALVIFAIGFSHLGRAPSFGDVVAACGLLVVGLAILYSLWMLAASLAFYVVKLDNLTFLFGAVFDAARWPSSVFRGALHLIFTFVIPISVMTTFPAEALLGRATLRHLALALGVGTIALIATRALWSHAVGRYTSASS